MRGRGGREEGKTGKLGVVGCGDDCEVGSTGDEGAEDDTSGVIGAPAVGALGSVSS